MKAKAVILALMSLLSRKQANSIGIVSLGILGAALLYGDGAITPAISVLSALEGLKAPLPKLEPYIVPMAVVILIGLFALQPQGSARIGKTVRAGHGALVHRDWAVGGDGHRAPSGPSSSRSIRVTGSPICSAMGSPAFSCSARSSSAPPAPRRLCRHGAFRTDGDPHRLVSLRPADAAFELRRASRARRRREVAAGGNPFFRLCPDALQIPLVILATAATIIASQAIISGAFSMTRQAIQLGLCRACISPRPRKKAMGQIYVGFVNWALMALT